jgi:clan AA aspartic protease
VSVDPEMKSMSPPYVEVVLSNPTTSDKSIPARALIDTGAYKTCIPKSVVETLDLQLIGEEVVSTAQGKFRLPICVVDIRIYDRWIRAHQVLVISDGIENPLLGWDILKEVWIEGMQALVEGRALTEVVNILDFVPSFKQTHVLVLGQDTTEIQRLRTIQRRLKFHGYEGVVVKEITDIEIQSVEEKVNMLASLCAFVVCENSQPSGHIDELKICSLNRFVTAILQEKGRGATWMQVDYPVDYSFIETFTYSNANEIDSAVDKAVEWARKKMDQRKESFNSIYRWRGDR